MPKDASPGPDLGAKASGGYHHGDLRQALLAAAWEKIARDGPESVSLSSLARSLGVSQPAPYRHFADRDALLAAVALQAFDLYEAEIRHALAGAARYVASSRIARAHVTFGLANRGLYRLMFNPVTPWAGDVRARAKSAFAFLFEAVQDVGLGAGARRRAVRIWAAAHGLVMLADQGIFHDDLGEESLSVRIEDIVS